MLVLALRHYIGLCRAHIKRQRIMGHDTSAATIRHYIRHKWPHILTTEHDYIIIACEVQ